MGTLTDKNGNKYVGDWKNDMMNEETYTDKIGHRYSGNWRNNKGLVKVRIHMQEIRKKS